MSKTKNRLFFLCENQLGKVRERKQYEKNKNLYNINFNFIKLHILLFVTYSNVQSSFMYTESKINRYDVVYYTK